LAYGMNPRVGAAGALQVYFYAKEFVSDPLQIALDAARINLRLPAGELGAVVFKG